ncbi:uncharacterized protein KY384_000772 [Bacidia gigantensis]|uniref:uncharacterized protein n=1 Tax=Bacidia gigantensis TaxID=2732470 RepID=UPI001D05A4FB|nr:uncharacterized protein KY384_000772 [Bacidia gigantensis]KAG8526010.1 hypothetical protein KY384_000772 [Bacidia gigantensis]
MHVLHTFLSLAPLFFTLIHSAPQPQTQNNAYSSIKPDNVVPDIDQKTLLPISQALLADSSINITITPLLNPNAKPIDPSALAAALSTLESALKTTYFGDPIAQYIPGANPALEGAFAQGRGPEGTGAQVRFGQTIAQLNTKDAPPKFTLAGLLDVVQTAQYWPD